MSHWSLDLGTTNTGLARWDAESQKPALVDLPQISRRPAPDDRLEAPPLVPTATEMVTDTSFRARLGRSRLFARRTCWGRHAWIGEQAVERNDGAPRPAFASGFKTALGHMPLQTIARNATRAFSARDVARAFIRELFAEARKSTGDRVTDLVITTPVDAYESYRAELMALAKRAGVRRVRFLDEPVAAAIGYGMGLSSRRRVIVVDFGGGTLDLALVDLSAREVASGACTVLAKSGRRIGGNTVDAWLLDAFARRAGYGFLLAPDAKHDKVWRHLMMAEARRVKEAVYFEDSTMFTMVPPDDMRDFESRIRGAAAPVEIARDDIVAILTERGMYNEIGDCLDDVLEQARAQGIEEDNIDDVLMVGGSTLLPQVYGLFEQRFGRGRVRAWQPFEAVAWGACVFAADAFSQSDYIVHDYAFVTHDPDTHDREHTIIIPRGTRIPTRPDLWKRQLVPTCSLGRPEHSFKLVIAEVGEAHAGERRFAWDAAGNLIKLGGDSELSGDALVVPLNERNPTMGTLKPPHEPGDRNPRLEISFGVNAERWLVATVLDLHTGKTLMDSEAVVRLL